MCTGGVDPRPGRSVEPTSRVPYRCASVISHALSADLAGLGRPSCEVLREIRGTERIPRECWNPSQRDLRVRCRCEIWVELGMYRHRPGKPAPRTKTGFALTLDVRFISRPENDQG